MSVNKPTKIVEKDMSTYDYSRYSKDISNKIINQQHLNNKMCLISITINIVEIK